MRTATVMTGSLIALEPRPLDRLDGVLDEVGQHLRDEPLVETGGHRLCRQVHLHRDVGQPHALEEHRRAHGFGQIGANGLGFGHARE